ncbi:hypothetical protein [Sphingomonas sp. LaA6.9]|uniref:hypothetical protein n=1 Tax=Sphingomonas sp. LaA6.9 TaxID=2919914 RepID=UPI001F4F8862|nr:hypothetical protein [Sphingomonas sp. LaA6.9]MCJ8157147.1 hypothetical protein [Sphingomonas sp. LaA6.9]
MKPREGGRLSATFELLPQPDASADAAKKKSPERESVQQRAVERQKPPEVDVTRIENVPVPSFLVLTREDYAAADIGRLPSRRTTQSEAGGGSSGSGTDARAVGEGPGGERLYNADWYRRPTHAELATYVPSNAPSAGWGLIACRTIDRYQVEDCQELGESPRGSGFARAVRLAAWQFRVLPPRIGGRPMVGSWVRIRIDYSEKGIAIR